MVELAERCRARMDAIFADYDVMVAPAAYGEAPVGMNAFAGAPLYMMWTVLHVPALSLPVLTGPNGMPVGLQVFAARHRDRALFAHGRWIRERLA